MTTHIYSPVAKSFFRVITLLLLFAGCFDEQLGNGYHAEMDSKERVKVTFNLNITGLMTPTRAEYGVDEQIETLDLFLFDENDLLTEVIHLTKNDVEESFTEHAEQYAGGEYNTPENSTTGTYTAWIDGNTSRIHFIANLKEGEFDFKEHEGASETEVIAPLVTQNRVYWGRTTFDGTSLSQNPVVLYRNYAKVRVGDVAEGLVINGWTLYHRPLYGTMAPCDRSKLNGGTTNEQESLNPFEFALGTSDVCLPLSEKCLMTEHNESNQTAGEEEINASSASVSYWLFEYREEEFASDEPVYAIFHITKDVNGTSTPLFYKIALLYDAEKDGYGNVTSRKPFAIKRNHEYTINFNGLSHEAGWETFDQAVNHDPANNTEITIEESVPEIVSANHTLRIEETEEGSTTVRYYKDYTDLQTIYTINDILVYYDGDDCATNSSSSTQGKNSLKVSWQGDAPAEYVANSLSVEQATDADGNAIAHTYRISFQMNGFSDSESLTKHYTEGVLCIAEQHEKLLKRYVKVYMGPAITFRPLLISSDIPNLTDERLTILFTIPDESCLPVDLYPIEVRFGSDRIDVEKNLYVDAMKVDFGADAAEHYTHVLRWQGTSATSTDWQWMAGAANTVTNAWGYKYIYTIDTPPTANEAQQRITLRTVITDKKDFKVLMEGRSTVTGTNVFNTRELDFMMQNNGTTVFNTTADATATIGEWITDTEGSSDQYKRIMLDGGLPETRYATRYVNIASGNLQGATVTIPYTLGTYENGEIVPDPDVQSDMASTITLWVHYDPTKFKPTTGTAQTDANGNTFVAITHDNTSATGSVTFNILDEAKNSMVFFTARNAAKYGTYSASTFVEGNVGYVHTGVNELQYSYRSAGALVSTLSQWEFNPAPSLEDAKYSFADDISIPAGKGQDLYVRIDRPKSQSGVKLLINTQGKLELQSAPRTVETTTTDAEGATTTTTVADYTFVQNGDGTYTITLAAFEQEYCYLHFKTKEFNSACTMTMSSTDESTIGYNSAELTVINATNPFLAFEFAPEEELAKVLAERTYSVATSDNPSNVVPAIKGALIGVRVYLPKALYTAMNNDNDGIENEDIFRFSFTSRNFEPVNNSSALTTVLENQSEFNYYTVTKSTKNNTTYIITVKEGALHEGKTITTAEGEEKESCYIDILLQSTAIESAENVKFLGTNETTTDLSFYPYNTAIACEGTYTVSIEQSRDNETWTTKPLSEVTDGSNIYYRITIPDWNLGRKNLPMEIKHFGKLAIPDGSDLIDINDNDDNTFVFNVTTTAHAETQKVFQLEKKGNIESGTQETIEIVPAKDRVKLATSKLMMAEMLAVTPVSVAISSSKTNAPTTIYENGSSLNLPYLDLPVEAGGSVNIVINLGTEYNDEVFDLTITSTDRNAVGLVPRGESTTATVTDGILTFELQSLNAGTAEIFTLNIQSERYILPEITQLMATSTTNAGFYNVYWTMPTGHARGLKQGEGNEIFDNQQTQNALPVPGSGTLALPYESYTHGIKFDSKGYISFYAPKDDMTLSVVLGLLNEDTGTLGIYKADGTQVNIGNDGKNAIDLDGTVITQALEEAGLYYLKRSSGSTFIVYALTLSLPSAPFGDFKWYATKTDNATVGRGSGTWGTADALITATDTDADEKLEISVSDFSQELHLNVAGLNDGETALTITGDYQFKGGTTSLTVTPIEDVTTLTLVPVTPFDANNELINGSFTLSGVSANHIYKQTVDVDIRPWVVLTTNVSNYNDVYPDGNGYGVLIPFMNAYEMSFTLKDRQHEGKTISFEPRLIRNGSNNAGNEYFQLYSVTDKTNWTNGYMAEFENAVYDKSYSFVWRAVKLKGTEDPVHQVKAGAYTDIIIKDENGNIANFANRNHIYYAHSNGKSISRLRPLAPFMNDGASQGYIQYSIDRGNTWNYVLGTDDAKLNVQLNGHISKLHTLPIGVSHIRVTIPSNIGDDDYANIAVRSGGAVNENFVNQGIVTDSDGNRWIKFQISADNEETWSNMEFYDNRTVPELGPSAKFNMKFEKMARVGLGTWESRVKYKNIVVTNLDNNTTVYSSANTASGEDWSTSTVLYHTGDSKSYTDNQLLAIADGSNGGGATAVLDIPIPSENYQITCRAQKESGAEGFLIMFDYLDDQNYKWWNIGGWGNKRHEVEKKSSDGNVTTFISTEQTTLVADNMWYNISIQVQNGIATCTCTPEEVGGYYMEYIYNPEETSTANTIQTAVYDYYCLDSSTKTNTLYKDGIAVSPTLLEEGKNNEGNDTGNDKYEFADNGLTLTAWQQIQSNSNITVATTPVGNTEERTLIPTKMGASQTVTIDMPYRMKVTIIWSPRSDKKGTGMKITYPDNSSETTTETVENKETKVITCPKGTLQIARGGNEFWLYYLKFEPYSGQ